jgi:hypothetical protein
MPCKVNGKNTDFDQKINTAATEWIFSGKMLGAVASPHGGSIVHPKQVPKDQRCQETMI